MTVEAVGEAELEIFIWTYEACVLPDGTPIEIVEYGFNESMSLGRATVPTRVLAEVHAEGLTIDDEVEPVSNHEILELLEAWTDDHSAEVLALVADGVDAPGEQEARAARPTAVPKFTFSGNDVYARVEFAVDSANRVDEDDHELSAMNVTEHVADAKLISPILSVPEAESVELAPNFFPN